MIYLRKISGPSMKPLLNHGQIAVFVKTLRVSPEEVVLCVIDTQEVVKKIIKIRPGEVWLEGVNSAGSTDSREYGWVSSKCVRGRLLLSLPMRKNS
jgi:phage repressor protein C with HTH and peptisase S24 domain